jgi:hypothetical protein
MIRWELLSGLLVLAAVTMPSGHAPGISILDGALYVEATAWNVDPQYTSVSAVASSNVVPVNATVWASCFAFYGTGDWAQCPFLGTATRTPDETYSVHVSALTCESDEPRFATSSGCGVGFTARKWSDPSWTGEGVWVGYNPSGEGPNPVVFVCPQWDPAVSAFDCYGIDTASDGTETCLLFFERHTGSLDSRRNLVCLFA